MNGEKVQIQFLCPDRRCQSIFTGYYWRAPNSSSNYNLNNVSKGTKKLKELPKPIEEISPAFAKIYQQADAAEQDGLLEICGVGYRKAIEFLVKDYAIKKFPDRKEEIEKKFLGKCIEDFIDDARVKSVAERATWLGNDEAHYVRQWEGKDLEDLKALIRLTIHWLEMVAETERFEREMPGDR